MPKLTSYLVCHDHIQEVKTFLAQFLTETRGKHNHSEWITFEIPRSELILNLMAGKDQPITQNFTLELQCNSYEELESLASKFGKTIHHFKVTKVEEPYTFHFISLPGPAGICKVEGNFSS
jgi:hypothetical protein